MVEPGHVTTILIADWLRGDAAREQRRRVVPGPAPDQVSCGWLGAGHVTTMLTSDWSRVCHVACPDIAATMPKIDARRLDGKKHRTSSALRGSWGLDGAWGLECDKLKTYFFPPPIIKRHDT